MANNQFPHPWSKMAQDYRKLRRQLPDDISTIAVNEFKENFRREGFREGNGRVVKWKKRKRNPRKSDKTRAILTKTGRLKRSLRKKPTYDMARVVTNVPYAQRHNEGDDIMPARPFMITTEPLLKDIEKHTFTELEKIWKRA